MLFFPSGQHIVGQGGNHLNRSVAVSAKKRGNEKDEKGF